ncbi:RNA-binding Raly-like protein [Dermochelys coriacea]|uniref:RNA-binding Raly-like protein n=1 Tax=Dermochelys coriacea TaxID=27794 RepID=UPI0018E90588|nr:RNA-binding Raly-like protein [Dermochelys coriacea]
MVRSAGHRARSRRPLRLGQERLRSGARAGGCRVPGAGRRDQPPPHAAAGPCPGAMTLFGSEDGCWRYLDMAREPKPSRARPGQKRQHGGTLYHSNCDLDYELYRDDFPYRVYEYQKIPPLINRIPVKTRRAHVGAGGKSSLIPHPGPRGSGNAALGRTKLRAEELHTIKGELSQIKAQVDSLLESLDRMDQRRERLAGERGSKEGEKKKKAQVSEEPSYAVGDSLRELQGKEAPAADAQSDLRDIDSEEESTDTEETMKNHTSDPEGSQ